MRPSVLPRAANLIAPAGPGSGPSPHRVRCRGKSL